MSGYAGYQSPQDTRTDYDAQHFLIEQLINRLATTALVRVVAVTSAGAVAPVGTVDVVPMVHQVDGVGDPTPHATIFNVPYFRAQGGADAIIIDPKVGDVGIAVFCSRDITGVKRSKAPSNPGSLRKYDWADALYIGGLLNGTPSQYVRFSAEGVSVVSTSKVSVTTPTTVEITAPQTTINGNLTVVGTMLNNGHAVGSTHRHLNSGGTGTGGVPE
jgi:hypothetical protein